MTEYVYVFADFHSTVEYLLCILMQTTRNSVLYPDSQDQLGSVGDPKTI